MIDRIYLTNFRRLAEADIKVRDGLTCLTGLNGTGKSSIIEAAEFCLYGRTKTGTTKETVRRHGADTNEPTLVAVDFTLGTMHYRCIRYLTRGLSPRASLRAYTDTEYDILCRPLPDSDETTPVPSTNIDKSLGIEVATGAAGVTTTMTELFGIDYDGFKASFVAQQKELDSLGASLSPEARKKFFNTLLGHEVLDDIRPEINREIRAIKTMLEALERQGISQVDVEKQIQAEQKALETLSSRIAKGTGEVQKQEAVLQTLMAQYDDLARCVAAFEADTRQLEQQQAIRQRCQDRMAALQVTIDDLSKQLEGYDPDTSVESRLQEVSAELGKAQEYARQKAERERLRVRIEPVKREIEELRDKVKQLKKLTEQEPDLKAASEHAKQAASAKTRAEENLNHIKSDGMRINALLAEVEAGRTAKCPTCGTDISSQQGRTHLVNERNMLRQRFTEAKREFEQRSAEAEAAGVSEANTRNMLRTHTNNIQQLGRVEREIVQHEAEVNGNQALFDQAQAYLAEHASDERSELAISDLGIRYEELKQQQAREKTMRESAAKLRDTQKDFEHERQRLIDAETEITRLQAAVKQTAKAPAKLAKVEQSRNEAQVKAKKFSDLLGSLQREQGHREFALQALEEKLQIAKEQAKSMAELRIALEVQMSTKILVEHLRMILPAKIAPAMSARASKLLETATNGMYRMVEINDSYEVSVYTDDAIQNIAMMSGGEQDVISLCIRVAISEMILSTKALGQQTLILDEIFGALDDERRASACQALRNLGALLPRIVCITHIDDIKDMADYTYVVERDENGVSRVREVLPETQNLMPHLLASADRRMPMQQTK